jgi:hypothetical protein
MAEGFSADLERLGEVADGKLLRARDAIQVAREELHRVIPDQDVAFNNPFWTDFAAWLDDYRRSLEDIMERAENALELSSAALTTIVERYRDADQRAGHRLTREEP